MKKMLNGWVIVYLVFAMGLSACGGGGGGGSSALPVDSLTIVNVSPTSAVAGVSTTFAVEVSYSLVTKDNGMLMIGFNTTAVGGYGMLPNPQPAVLKGSGTYTFNVTTTPKDWSPAGSFQVYVNLSENPHPATWTPLASATKAIAISAAPASVSLSANDLAQAPAQIQIQALTQCNGVTCF